MNGRRRAIRLSQREDDLIVEAAGLLGLSVSEYLVAKAVTDAERTVEAHHAVRLDSTARRRFLAALDRPVPPPHELLEQVRKARPLAHDG